MNPIHAFDGLSNDAWTMVGLVATRIIALVALAPLFGPRTTTPWRVKVALAVALILLVAPTHWRAATELSSPDMGQTIAWVCREAAIGLALGLSVLLVAAGFCIGGQLVGDAIGFQRSWLNGEMDEPSGRMLELTGFALLLAAGGHRMVLDAMLNTFQSMPVAAMEAVELRGVVELARHSFSFGLRAAAPVIAAAMAAQVLIAMLARVQPTLRHAAIQPSATALAGVGMWLVSLGTLGLLAMDELQGILGEVQQLLWSTSGAG